MEFCDDLKNIINNQYSINISKTEKNEESTDGNVYIVYSNDKKYVLKIYNDLNHTLSITSMHNTLSNDFNIPKIINTKNDKLYTEISESKYIVLYSFMEGIQITYLDKFNADLIKQIALNLRKLHDFTNVNEFNLKNIPFDDYNLKRKSLIHFDLTKHNIFYNEINDKIGFIDFDDVKYGASLCDIAILISLLFLSKKRGVDIENINLFIDTYYGNDINLKIEETKYIKNIALSWVDYILNYNNFDSSLKESFEVKKKLIEKVVFKI